MSICKTYPEIAAQWHPTKNGILKPENYTCGSGIIIWWSCSKENECGCKHEWQAAIGDRCRRERGCPYCSIPCKKICKHKSLAFLYPNIAKQWHPTKNGEKNPGEIIPGSNEKVWWLCDKSCSYGCIHEWSAVVEPRCSRKIGCPFCGKNGKSHCYHSSVKFRYPKIAEEWDILLNGDIKPENISSGANIKVNWICKISNHKWKSVVSSRCLSGNGCPFCKNKTEKQLLDFLKQKFKNIKTQLKLENCKKKTHLPFDFFLSEKGLIIELDGAQHFKQVANWTTPEKAIKRDIFKMQKAEEAGYKVIRIFQEDVYNNDEKWLEENILPEILSEDRGHIFISTIELLYDEHISLYNKEEAIILSDEE